MFSGRWMRLIGQKKGNPNIKIYAVDYWNPKDNKTIKKIYAKQRSYGFVPYVATIDLQSVVAEPQ
jgi:endo-alpha-1,4-polygalactosaminidase (GH114 family)